MEKRSGKLFIISSPSGGGKSTVIQELLKKDSTLEYSVSATTRPPRDGEKDQVDYIFLPENGFKRLIEENAFIEWAKVHGCYYGTLRERIKKYLSENKFVLLDIDVQGGCQIKKEIQDSVLIFLLPPSVEELENRLLNRGTESKHHLNIRLNRAKDEMKFADEYDFQIINDHLDKTVEEVNSIIQKYQKA